MSNPELTIASALPKTVVRIAGIFDFIAIVIYSSSFYHSG